MPRLDPSDLSLIKKLKEETILSNQIGVRPISNNFKTLEVSQLCSCECNTLEKTGLCVTCHSRF